MAVSQRSLLDDGRMAGALFDESRQYRYQLWRNWHGGSGTCNFIMLNPSTADEKENDPTVERCERRAREWGYGGLFVTNLFSFRATDPREMKAAVDPIGPQGDEAIIKTAKLASIVICAWGTHGRYRERSAQVMKLLEPLQGKLHCLKVTSLGEPYHPLYLSYELKPIPFGR